MLELYIDLTNGRIIDLIMILDVTMVELYIDLTNGIIKYRSD